MGMEMNTEILIKIVDKVSKMDKGYELAMVPAEVLIAYSKMLVQECADIAKHNVMNISTYADAEFVEEQINKHFGME